MIGGVEVVRRNEHAETGRRRGGEDFDEVLDGAVLGDAGLKQGPVPAVGAQDIVLGIDDDDRGVGGVVSH